MPYSTKHPKRDHNFGNHPYGCFYTNWGDPLKGIKGLLKRGLVLKEGRFRFAMSIGLFLYIGGPLKRDLGFLKRGFRFLLGLI